VCGGSKEAALGLFTVIKIDSGGNEQWHYASAGPANMGGSANCITLDDSGSIYIGGAYRNISNRQQIAIVKLKPSGDTLWTYIYPNIPPSPYSDNTRDIVTSAANDIYILGRIWVEAFDSDIVVLKYTSQHGAKEVQEKEIVIKFETSSILKKGVEISPPK